MNAKYILQILLILLCFSCSKEHRKLTGNWKTCGIDGSYIELYVRDGYFRFNTANAFGGKYIFNLDHDTIKFISENDYMVKNISRQKIIVTFQSKDKMVWNFVDAQQKWELNRLTENVKKFPDSITSKNVFEAMKIDELIQHDVSNRAKTNLCPDIRTKKQKEEQDKNDSIARQKVKDFRF